MGFTRKKSHRLQNASGSDLSEQAMNDSVRAAQIIFQKHASSQSISTLNSTPSSVQSSTSIVSPQPRPRRAIVSTQSHSSMSVKSSSSQARRKPSSPIPIPSSKGSGPERSDSAQAAAQLAAANWNQNEEHEIFKPARSPIPRSSIDSDPRKLNVSRNIQEPSKKPPTLSQGTLQVQSHVQSHVASSSPLERSTDSSKSLKNLVSPSTTSLHTMKSVASSRTSVPTKPKDQRATMARRVPPPNIYLDNKSFTETDNGYAEEDEDNDQYDLDANNELYSVNTTTSSNSDLSIISDRSSYDDSLEEREDEDDEEDLDETLDDDYKSDSDYPYSDRNNLTSSSLVLPALPATSTKTNASYSTLNKINNSNVTYQGTLPDLIPNHTRKTRMEKLKTKIFGSKGRYRGESPNDPPQGKSSVTSNEDGKPVVTTSQNMKFKTTMRGKESDSSHDRSMANNQENNDSERQRTGQDGFSDDSSTDSENSTKERNTEKKKQKRSYRIKRRLKNTAAVVPYKHHLHHHDHRHNYKGDTFNEDKPWKSHNDVGFVTPQERKRYEGMWVSNRCLYLELLPWWDAIMAGKRNPAVPLPDDGLMLNLVVKDIWVRSNLPNDLLSQIYDKVDTRKDGTLDRKSFIVGMWLVDQSLYGRKLPRELDQVVWDSVERYVVNVINPATLKHIDKSKKKQLKQEIKHIKKEIKNTHL